MVVYDDVSKFFPVRIRPGQKERPEFMVALDRVNATVRQRRARSRSWGRAAAARPRSLRLTAGLIAADEGRITIEGTQATAPRKDACMVFQNFGLLPWRTVLGNVEFRSRSTASAPRAPRSGARHFIELVGLAAFAEHYPHELSGGMQQRVRHRARADAQAILIFMDEPFGALDAQTREQLQEDFLSDLVADGRNGRLRHPAASTRRCSCPTASSCSTPLPGASAPSSSHRWPPSVWAATSARIPILASTGPNCGTCWRSEP